MARRGPVNMGVGIVYMQEKLNRLVPHFIINPITDS